MNDEEKRKQEIEKRKRELDKLEEKAGGAFAARKPFVRKSPKNKR